MTFSFSRSLLAASLGLSLVLSSASAFADAAYEVTDGITLYGEALFSNRKSRNTGW